MPAELRNAIAFFRNLLTRKPYIGVNPLILEMALQRHGFISSIWATFNQWKQMGGHRDWQATWIVHRGTVSAPIHFSTSGVQILGGDRKREFCSYKSIFNRETFLRQQ
ncbi:ArdC-like ssDNA-binding domain-containing protein [Novipirellula rosea]|uniref:ArdC-like ssDNA-binding domain-containing protein n=1 Tax=Novipirellula rosea TaxID=1031540 RepID=UPI003CD0732A